MKGKRWKEKEGNCEGEERERGKIETRKRTK